MIAAFTGRAFRYLSSEVRGLQAAAYVLAVSALLSSLLALARDRLLAHVFGASTTLDVYYASFRIPDMLFVALGALVSVYILIPEITRRSGPAQRDYIDTIVAGFSMFAVLVSLALFAMTPFIVPRIFPGLAAAGAADQLVLLTRIMLLQPVLLGLSNIAAAITQTRYRYALYSLSPLLYNLGIIIGIIGLYPRFGIIGLAWGVVAGALMHLAVQLPSAVADGFFRRIPLLRDVPALRHTVMISVPRALALSMTQLSLLALTALAALLSPGSVAVFMLAFNLQSVPLSIVGASYSVAAFPTLAAALSRGARAEFVSHVVTAARYVLFWSLPCSALILVLRAHIVRVILGSGAFDWSDTRLTAAAFAVLAFSLAAQGILLLLIRAYYAAGQTAVPLIASAAVAAGTIALSSMGLVTLTVPHLLTTVEQFLRVEDIAGSAIVALAIAFSVSNIAGAALLALHFEYRFGGFFAGMWRPFAESALAALTAGVVAHFFLSLVSSFDASFTAMSIFVQGFTAGLAGILAASVAYWLVGSREYSETFASVHARLWRKPAHRDVTLVASAEEQNQL